MTSLGAVGSPSAQSHYERALSRRTVSLIGDVESGYVRDVFEIPHPPWAQEYVKSEESLAKIKNKKVREFYEKQNQTLAKYGEVDELLSGELVHSVLHSFEHPSETTPLLQTEGSKREKNRERLVSLAINLNFVLNVVLLTAKGVAVLLSGSISIWASFVDSFMACLFQRFIHSILIFLQDFLSTVIVIWTSIVISSYKKKGNQGSGKYPTGKQRMEPLGVVIFSVFMIAMFLQVGVEGIKRLLAKDREAFNLDKTTLTIMAVTIATKTVAWLLSARVKSNGVQALAQDNKNDVFFTTFSVIFPGIGTALDLPWLDPLGGVVLSLYIIVEWTETLMFNFRQLSGRSADPDEYRRMLYLITRFKMPKVSYLEVYHAGTELICEADLQFPRETPFEVVHNVSEAIQVALECLEDVNRAYIHADFTVLNPASHVRRRE